MFVIVLEYASRVVSFERFSHKCYQTHRTINVSACTCDCYVNKLCNAKPFKALLSMLFCYIRLDDPLSFTIVFIYGTSLRMLINMNGVCNNECNRTFAVTPDEYVSMANILSHWCRAEIYQ